MARKLAKPTHWLPPPQGRSQREGPVQRLAGRPVEEDEDQQQLRHDERDAEPPVAEEGALFHRVLRTPVAR